MKTAIAALLFAGLAAPAGAGCLPHPKFLTPGPGELYGCPVYVGSKPAVPATQTAQAVPEKFWFSNSIETTDNNLYGFFVDGKSGASDWSSTLRTIASQNWKITQESNAYGIDFALIGITFRPTGTIAGASSNGTPIIVGGGTFPSPDGMVFTITGPLKQGF